MPNDCGAKRRGGSIFRRLKVLTFLVGLVMIPTQVAAQGMSQPADAFVSVLLKVLTFDRSVKDRPSDDLLIVVVSDPADSSMFTAADALLSELSRYRGQKILGRTIKAESRTTAELLEQDDRMVDVICLTGGIDGALPNILAWSRRNRAFSFTCAEELAERGVGVWLGVDGIKPRIQINLLQVRAEGRDLDSQLLSLADVRR